jgi:hypothetical protein
MLANNLQPFSIDDPILRFRRDELLDNFDKLQTLLGPWQVDI